MKKLSLFLAAVCLFVAGAAVAQEHWTEGPVWQITMYRTTPGHFDDYLKYLRTHSLPTTAEAKKQGLLLDYKIFVKQPRNAQDWDIAIATLHSSYGKALDFNPENDAKAKAIQADHWKTKDQDKQRELTGPRLEWRTFVGSELTREVTLRPMP
jgi:hypothetical protein